MFEGKTNLTQDVARNTLGTFMVGAGIGHFTFARRPFQAQVPNWVPVDKDTTVLLSGVVEVALGLGMLLLKGKNRVRLGIGLATFYVAIFPGNWAQYKHSRSSLGLDTDRKRLVRLVFQPVLIGTALWSTGAWKTLKENP
ncbi:MAG: DoxX family protein [Janthinobacterium lividum]